MAMCKNWLLLLLTLVVFVPWGESSDRGRRYQSEEGGAVFVPASQAYNFRNDFQSDSKLSDPTAFDLIPPPAHFGINHNHSVSAVRRALPMKGKKVQTPYKLKPGDRIEISVWGEDMTKSLVVQPDGSIGYVLVGELKVQGLTIGQVRNLVSNKLKEFIVDPRVTVIGQSFEGNYVSVMGAVQRPGRHVIGHNDRLLDVMTKAGGVRLSDSAQGENGGEMANLSKAYLSRSGKLISVDFPSLIYKGDMTQNIFLEIGDFIYIPSASNEPIYVTGEVNRPTIVPHRGKPDLLHAILAAGGFNKKASKGSVMIVRGSLYAPRISKVNVGEILSGKRRNIYLQAGDIVHVSPTFITRVERLAEQIIPFLNSFEAGDEAVHAVRGSSF